MSRGGFIFIEHGKKKFLIRSVQRADNLIVDRLIRAVLAEFDGCAEGSPKDSQELEDIHKAYESANSKFYVIEHNGQVVGCGGVRPLSAPSDVRTCELRRMYFLKEARGIGLGYLLLKRCLDDAVQMGYQRCYLETKSNMIEAQKLYERFGFIHKEASLSASKNGCDLFYAKDLALNALRTFQE